MLSRGFDVAASVAGGTAALTALAGCSTAVSESDRSPGPHPLEAETEWAREAGASDVQLERLEDGVVAFAELDASVGEAIECIRELGFVVEDYGTDTSMGFPTRSYAIRTDTATDGPGPPDDAEHCFDTHSRYVEIAWVDSPEVVVHKSARFDQNRKAVAGCFAEQGETLPAEATFDEAKNLATELFLSTGVDCFTDSGVSY